MPGKDPALSAALDAQAREIADVFGDAGYELVEPRILQPADIFLERAGEEIRQRTYVFSDPGGAMLCLRPDLTVPTCRYYLERGPGDGSEARYRYHGPAFRYQPAGEDGMHPREFEQAGIEYFGGRDAEAAEVEVATLGIAAVERAGLTDYRIRLGDLGLFSALLRAVPMPERWRRRLMHHFWRPHAFRETLTRLASPRPAPAGEAASLLQQLKGADPARARELVGDMLAASGTPLFGGRGIDEIAERLLDKVRDLDARPLDRAAANAIESYLAVRGHPREALATVTDLAARSAIDIDAALAACDRRLTLLADQGVDLDRSLFSAEFGRNLEYYTGFVFQIEVDGRRGAVPLAGGGRYDGLMQDIGANGPIPAVGCAIHTERLLVAVRGEAAS